MVYSTTGREEIDVGRIPFQTDLVGCVVQVRDNKVYEDIFGLHLGCYTNPKWDTSNKYVFHQILSSDGTIRHYCVETLETGVIKVIA